MKICDDENFMREAIRLAKKAFRKEETPIGCVIVHDDKVIARGYNRRNTDKSTLPTLRSRRSGKRRRSSETGGLRSARSM